MASPLQNKKQKHVREADRDDSHLKQLLDCVNSGDTREQIRSIYNKKHEEQQGEAWAGNPVPPKLVEARWPKRKTVCSCDTAELDGWGGKKQRVDEAHEAPAVLHFERVTLAPVTGVKAKDGLWLPQGPFEVAVGDDVDVVLDNNQRRCLKVMEMWEDLNGARWIRPHWYYDRCDTCLAMTDESGTKYILNHASHNEEGLRRDRLWLAAPDSRPELPQKLPLIQILRPVIVKFILPGSPVPDHSQGWCDYWCDQTYDEHFGTFKDLWDFGFLAPAVDVDALPATVSRSPEAKGLPATSRVPPRHAREAALAGLKVHDKELYVLELCAGGGGLSFIAQRDEDAGVAFKCRWAVDFNEDACKTYRANHPDADAYFTGIDEFLWQSKKWKELSDRYPDDWTPPAEPMSESDDEKEEADAGKQKGGKGKRGKAKQQEAEGKGKGKKAKEEEEPQKEEEVYEVEAICNIRLQCIAPRGTKGQGKGQLLREIRPDECWLQFYIKWKGYEDGVDAWQDEQCLMNCEEVLAEFVQRYRREHRIPLPGDVALLAGGPPCQGISGLNRHAESVDILSDPKNRLVKVYYQYLEFFQPNYILMEQVQDIMTKLGGVYLRFAMGKLVENRYQTRVGIIMAGDQGCPQGRNRCFVWGANSGVSRLPPFPEPSHKHEKEDKIKHRGIPKDYQACYVKFTSDQSEAQALPHMKLGDAFTDLPAVGNYCMSDAQEYKCAPERPYQVFMRREPPPHQASRAERIARAEGMMQAQREEQLQYILYQGGKGQQGLTELGFAYFNTKNEVSYARKIWKTMLDNLSPEDRVTAILSRSAMMQSFAESLGRLVVQEAMKAAKAPKGPLRDHRPWPCNADDYLRMTNVPQAKGASFREMTGLLTHPDKTCCSGHFHAYQAPPDELGGPAGPSACEAGGVLVKPKSSTTKEGRIDNHDLHGWRGVSLEGCPSYTAWLPTCDLVCPRWCTTYKGGQCMGRHACYGRMSLDEIQSTVVTRAQPHNLQLLAPEQDRVVSVRENARCQGFPDYYVLVGTYQKKGQCWSHKGSVEERYLQIGNAVAPPVAAALGRCLLLAAAGDERAQQPVVAVPDPELMEALSTARSLGLKHYREEFPCGHPAVYSYGGKRGEAQGGEDEESDPSDGEDEEGGAGPSKAGPSSKPRKQAAGKKAAVAGKRKLAEARHVDSSGEEGEGDE